MKERPIIFSAPMVRALLDGTKTQTRRVVKPQPEWTEPATIWQQGDGHSGPGWYAHNEDYPDEGALFYRSLYGQPGDRLWVKETYWRDDEDNAIIYSADPDADIVDGNKCQTGSPRYNWRPSIFMPRAASRITLEVTAVRVERLQDIREDEAKAEGCAPIVHEDGAVDCGTRKTTYRNLWDRINGPDSWALNPWVWVIEFKRVQP